MLSPGVSPKLGTAVAEQADQSAQDQERTTATTIEAASPDARRSQETVVLASKKPQADRHRSDPVAGGPPRFRERMNIAVTATLRAIYTASMSPLERPAMAMVDYVPIPRRGKLKGFASQVRPSHRRARRTDVEAFMPESRPVSAHQPD